MYVGSDWKLTCFPISQLWEGGESSQCRLMVALEVAYPSSVVAYYVTWRHLTVLWLCVSHNVVLHKFTVALRIT